MRSVDLVNRLPRIRLIGIRVAPVLFLTLGGCMAAGGAPSGHRVSLTAPIRRLTREVLARLDRDANPSTLTRPYFWRVDGQGRVDLVTSVRAGHIDQVIRWVVEKHGRIIAKDHAVHEFEAWIPARIVFKLARKPAVRNIRFPHFAMVRH